MKTKIIIFSLFISVLLLSGCIQQIGSFRTFSHNYADSLRWEEIASPEKECQIGNCTCMVCKKGPSIWPTWSSLAGGFCKFDNECNQTKFIEYSNTSTPLGKNYSIRYFMIGQGPSFADYTAANTLCNNKLKMAVQWLIATPQRTYDDVDPNQAICLTDKDVIPVYVLYSKGENINISKTKDIAYTLGHEGRLIRAAQKDGPVGPVIVTTEIDFNSSNDTVVKLIADQVEIIDSWCNDWTEPRDPKIYCFVGIAPKIGDYEGFEKVIKNLELKGYNKEKLQKFVLLAYGLNSHYVNVSCNGNRMLYEARAFSQYARNNYSIASVIPYILIDVGQPDASGMCKWTEIEAVNTYNSIFTNGIPTLSKYGIIGIALYSPDANSMSNPLNCVDCGVVQYEMRKRAWFGNCQKYTTTKSPQGIVAIPQSSIRFPNNNAADCGLRDDQNTPNFYLHSRDFAGEIIDILNPKTPKMDNPQEIYWSCSSCLSERRDLTDVFKETGGYNVLLEMGIKKPETSNTAKQRGITDACTNYSEIDYYASRFNVDPMLVRALIATESSFDKCAVAIVCNSYISKPSKVACTPGNYMIGYEYMEDPDGECKFEEIQPIRSGNNVVLPYTYVGLGLMQVLESPYTFWPPNGKYSSYFEEAKKYGRKEDIAGVNATCGGTFNPFNVSNAACWGTAKLAKYIKESEKDAKEVAVNASDVDEVNILKGLIGVYKYKGLWGANANLFTKSWCIGQSSKSVGDCLIDAYRDSAVVCNLNANGQCTSSGNEEGCTPDCKPNEDICYYDKKEPKDFIWFINCIARNEKKEGTFYPYVKSGLQVLAYYVWLNSNCAGAHCPSWIKLNQVLNMGYDNQNNPYGVYENYYSK